jgi:hypothetical protein
VSTVGSYRHPDGGSGRLVTELDANAPDSRPGFYYVTCRNSAGDYAFIRGPWVDDHAGALAAKRAVQTEGERVDPRAVFYAWGTARSETDLGPGVLGGPLSPEEARAIIDPPPVAPSKPRRQRRALSR